MPSTISYALCFFCILHDILTLSFLNIFYFIEAAQSMLGKALLSSFTNEMLSKSPESHG